MKLKNLDDFDQRRHRLQPICFIFALVNFAFALPGAFARPLCDKTFVKLHSMNSELLQISVDNDGIIARVKNRQTNSETRIEHAVDARWAPQFSSDRSRLLMALDYRTVRFFDVKSGQHRDFKIEGSVNDVKFSPDGSKMLIASEANTAEVFNLVTGELEAVIRHGDGVLTAQFSPDTLRVVTASRDYTAKVVNLRTNQIETIIEHGHYVLSAQFSPDSSRLVTASVDGSIKVLDLDTGKVRQIRSRDEVRAAKLSPDGLSIVMTLKDGSSKSFELQAP